MPIKTLHITNAYHSASGGIRAFYRALLEAANRRGRLMRLIVPGERSEIEEVGSCGRIYHIAARRAFLFDNRYRLLAPTTYLPPLRGELWRVLRDERPGLIEVCDKYSVNWLGGLLRRGWIPGLRRPPLVGMSCERMDDNVDAFLGRSRAGRLWSRFYLGYLYIPFFDYHIANSSYTAAELRDAMRARHERPVYVRPMGVTDSFFQLYDELSEQFPSSRFARRNNHPAAFPVPEEYEQPGRLESHTSPRAHAGERRRSGYWRDPGRADSWTGSRDAS